MEDKKKPLKKHYGENKKITEKLLLDNFIKVSNGFSGTKGNCFVSKVDGETFTWCYLNRKPVWWPNTLNRDVADYAYGEIGSQKEMFCVPLQVSAAKHPNLAEINTIVEAIYNCENKDAKNQVNFVYYSGKSPNLCEGELILRINGEYAFFGSKSLSSRGNAYIDENHNEVITKGKWKVKIPKEYSKYTKQIHKAVNDNIPKGCCGGCI